MQSMPPTRTRAISPRTPNRSCAANGCTLFEPIRASYSVSCGARPRPSLVPGCSPSGRRLRSPWAWRCSPGDARSTFTGSCSSCRLPSCSRHRCCLRYRSPRTTSAGSLCGALVWLLGVLWFLEELSGLLKRIFLSARDATPLMQRSDVRRRLTASTAARLLPVVVLLSLVAAGRYTTPDAAARANTNFGRTLSESRPLGIPQPGRVVTAWRFSDLPTGWSASTGTTVHPGGSNSSLVVSTTTNDSGYEVKGPTLRLPRGNYTLLVGGDVSSGGMQPGILDVRKDVWVKEGLFWSGQWWMRSSSKAIGLRFTLANPTEVQPILANWSPGFDIIPLDDHPRCDPP